MITPQDIRNECYSATYIRAVSLSHEDYLVQDRRVEYGRYTNVDAYVESASDPGFGYDASISINERSDVVADYYCTCPAHRKYPGMCKHVAAMALLFIKQPETFFGYSGKIKAKTSPSLQHLMAKKLPTANSRAYALDQQIAAGTLSLELTLEEGYSGLLARFRVVSPRAGYVVKHISEFLRHLENREFYEYGKKLAFTHSLELFTPQAQKVIHVLRRLAVPDEVHTHYGRSYQLGGSNIGRDLPLSSAGAIDLLDAYVGVSFFYDDGTRIGSSPEIAWVEPGNPPVKLELQEIEGGYEILRGPSIRMLSFDNRAYAIMNHVFYQCTPEFAPCADFLQSVYCSWDTTLTIAEEDLPAFCSTVLPLIQDGFGLDVPSALEALKPLECKLEFYLDKADDNCQCLVKAKYGLQTFNPLEPTSRTQRIGRDIPVEAQACGTVLRFLPRQTVRGQAETTTVDEVAELVFRGLHELRLLGEVFTTPAFDRMVSTSQPRVQTGVSLVGNLINLQMQATDLPPEELFDLLDSYHRRKTYHRLRDGSLLDLAGRAPEDMGLDHLEKLYTSLGLTEKQVKAGSFDLPLHQAFLIDAELEDQRKDEAFQEFIDGFQPGKVRKHAVPASLENVLRPYQKDGFDWLNLLSDFGFGGILADEMGLGKSLQVITYLLHQREALESQPALIVCPASLVYNWKAEFGKFAPGLNVVTVSGSKLERQRARAEYSRGGAVEPAAGAASCVGASGSIAPSVQVFVTSYDSLRIDVEEWARLQVFACIIDEAQYIKNHNTKVARSVKSVQAQHRIALTGTPIENRLSELWSIFDFLMPGMLGSYNRFKERYELPIVGGSEDAQVRLRSLVGPFILRRRKEDVLSDLPEKLEQVITCKMDSKQRKLYDAHEQRLRLKLEGDTEEQLNQERLAVLAELTHLRQLCCDPRLLYEDYRDPGIKIEAMLDLIASAYDSGQKVLLFSQFTSFLDLIAAQLRTRKVAYYTITGKTPKKQRVELVDRFNGDDTPVFLISLKAGGTGLNLTGASVVIHADPWWNEAAQRQATDRAHRIGQRRTVTVYQVIAEGTIEERILKLQEAKRDLADQVLDAQGASLGSLSREDLVALLSEG